MLSSILEEDQQNLQIRNLQINCSQNFQNRWPHKMTENPKLEDMDSDSDHLLPNCQTGEFGGNQKIHIVDHVNGLQHSETKSDSFVVDMERFSHLIEKDANSRIMLQRNLSRKGSIRTAKRNVANNERDVSMQTTSPTDAFHGGSMPDKLAVVASTPNGHSIVPQVHHQITITNGSLSSTTAAESKSGGKRFGFRRSSPAGIIDPRRILYFFATLSCMGTILLIYFTLSMSKLNGVENASSYQ